MIVRLIFSLPQNINKDIAGAKRLLISDSKLCKMAHNYHLAAISLPSDMHLICIFRIFHAFDYRYPLQKRHNFPLKGRYAFNYAKQYDIMVSTVIVSHRKQEFTGQFCFLSAHEEGEYVMRWLYGIIVVFSILTIYFTYVEYKKNVQLKKAFTIISILESLVILLTVLLFISTIIK